MAGIDKRIIVRIEAEDAGFAVGVQRASREIDKFSKNIGKFASFKAPTQMTAFFKGEYTRGLRDSIRSTQGEVERFMKTLSSARATDGTKRAYQHMASAHGEVLSKYRQEIGLIEARKKRLDELIARERMLQGVISHTTDTLRKRSNTQSERDQAKLGRSKAQSELKGFSKELADLRAMESADAKRLQNLNRMAAEQQEIASGYDRLKRASDTVKQAFDNEAATIRKIQQLEQQRLQATDKRVTKARIEAEAAKKLQDTEVQNALKLQEAQKKAQQYKAAPLSQKAAAFLQNYAVAASKAATVFGGLLLAVQVFTGRQKALGDVTQTATGKLAGFSAVAGAIGMFLSRGSQESLTLSNRMMKIAAVSALVIGGLSKVIGMLKRAVGALAMLGVKFAQVGVQVGRLFVQSMLQAVSAIGKMIGFVGRLSAKLVSSIGSWARSRKEAAAYRREIGQTVDAEGWHSRSLKGLVGNVVNMNRWINTLGSSVRQLGQAFQNAGTTLSIFLSYPTSRILGGMWSSVLDFDKSLIEVRKNSDLLLDSIDPTIYDLQSLKDELLEIVSQTPTPLQDIGAMAADTARLGLSPDFIAPFVKIMDQLVVATDIPAQDATDNIGKILNIFYDLSSEGVKDVEAFTEVTKGLGSAINELGQANPIGEKDIVATLLRMAPAAATIGMPLPDAVGLSASVASASASPERAGTQLNSALVKAAQNVKDIAAAANVEVDFMMESLSQDPTETLLAIVNGIAGIENEVVRTQAATELFGLVGGKAASTLAASFGKTAENVALAREAFEDGQSLAREFERALDAVSNQIGLLKNQFAVIGVSLGDAFLPVITDILAYVVPVMQAVSALFKTLDDKVKLTIVGFGLLAAAIGPVLYAVGSLMFSIGIMITGLTGLFTVIGGLVKIPLTVVGALLSLLSPFMAIKFAALGAVAAVVFFGNQLLGVGQVIQTMASNMFAWGYNMFMSFAEGIYQAAEAVVQAVFDTLSAIAAMLRSFSPPKEGPLKNIDKWGTNIATTFAEAFKRADLSGVAEFGNKINATLESTIRGLDFTGVSLFNTIYSDLKSLVDLVEGDTKQAATSLIGLLSVLQNGTGDAGAAFAEMAKLLGPFGKDFNEIIKAQVEYNVAVGEGEEIQKELDELDKKTQEKSRTIASDTTMSVSERLSKIRGTKASSASRRDVLTEQLEVNKATQESLQQFIEYQKSLIEIFKVFFEQETGFGGDAGDAAMEKLDKLDEAGEEITDIGLDIDGVKEKLKTAQEGFSESFAKMALDGGKFVEQMGSAKDTILGFIDGITGAGIQFPEGLKGFLTDEYSQGYIKGKEWREGILKFIDDLKSKIDTLKEFGAAAQSAFYVFGLGASGTDASEVGSVNTEQMEQAKSLIGDQIPLLLQLGQTFKYVTDTATEYFGYLAALFTSGDGVMPLQKIIDDVKAMVLGFAEGFSSDNPLFQNVLLIVAPLQSIVDSFAIIAGLVFDNLGTIGFILGEIAQFAIQSTGYLGAVVEFLKSLAGFGNFENFSKNLELAGGGWIASLFTDNGIDGPSFAQGLIDKITGWFSGADFSEIGKQFGEKLQQAVFGQKNEFTGQYSGGLFGNVEALIDPGGITQFLTSLITTLAGFISTIDMAPLVSAIGLLLAAVFAGLADADAMTVIGSAIARFIALTISELPVQEFTQAAAAIISGIVLGLKDGIESKELTAGLSSIADGIIGGLASLPWSDAAQALGTLATKLATELAGAPWTSAATSLSELLNTLVSELAKPSLWSSVGSVLGSIAGAIAGGILHTDWGNLFSAEAMGNVAAAFVGGFYDAMKNVLLGSDLTDEQVLLAQGQDVNSEDELKTGLNTAIQNAFKNPDPATISTVNAFAGTIISKGFVIDSETTAKIQEISRISEEQKTGLGSFITSMNNANAGGAAITRVLLGADRKMSDTATQFSSLSTVIGDTNDPMKSLEDGIGGFGKNVQELTPWLEDAGTAIQEFFLGWIIPKPASAAPLEGAGASGAIGPKTAEESGWPMPSAPAEQGGAPAQEPSGATSPGQQAAIDVSMLMQQLTTSVISWAVNNIDIVNGIGRLIMKDILGGMILEVTENGALSFASIPLSITTWIVGNIINLENLGKGISQHIRNGISFRLSEDTTYYDAIATAMSAYVSSVGEEHSISKDSEDLGERIMKAIARGVKENWKKVRDSLEEALEKALDNVEVSSGTPAGGGGGAGANKNGTSFWKGGWTWVGEGGKELVNLPRGSRILSNEDSYDLLYGSVGNNVSLNFARDSYVDEPRSYGGGVTINISGDVVVDKRDRIDELADKISREIGRKSKLVSGVR